MERREVLVVGGGQAGLAVGYFLARQGRDFVILEAADDRPPRGGSVGTRSRCSRRPGTTRFRAWPSRARRIGIPVEMRWWRTCRLCASLRLACRAGQPSSRDSEDRWRLPRRARRPHLRGRPGGRRHGPVSGPAGTSDQPGPRCRGRPVPQHRLPISTGAPNGPVLVVGGGNTGYQIAEDLAGSHEVHLSIGSKQKPLPQRILGRDLFWYPDKTGLIRKSATSRIGRRLQQNEDTLIGSSPKRLRRHGVELHGGPSRSAAPK